MHLWSCTTDRGTPSSAAPGPPSRQFSAWLRSERPASPSEHTLHKSEQALFSISSTFFISASSSSFSWCLSFFFSPSLHLFLRCPWPLRDNLQTLLNLFKASPRKNSLFPASSCQNIHKSKQLKKPEAKPTEQRMHFRWNRTKLTTTAEKRGVHVFAFAFFLFLFARPASVRVIAWTLSVSLDVACVGPRFGGLRGGSGGGRM